MARSELLQLARSSYGVSTNGIQTVASSLEIAAGALPLDIFWAWQIPPNLSRPVLERLRVTYSVIQPFTAPETAGRLLAFCLLDSLPSGVGVSNLRNTLFKSGLFSTGNGPLITSVSTLPPSGAPPDLNDVFTVLDVSAAGSAGDRVEWERKWTTGDAQMITVFSGQVLGLITPFGMDAGGTFSLTVEAELQSVPEELPNS